MSERNFVLFTDSDCDVTPEIAKKYGYELISMPYTIDGVEVKPYVDFDKFDYHAFYDRLRGGTIPTTSALSPVEYINYFEPFFKAGKDILYVHFSAAMSATFNAMRLALEELAEKYPERRLYEVDTKGITVPSLAIVMQIGDLVKKGASVEDVLEWAKTNVDKQACYFYADDLKFFHKSGRVSGFAAFFGGLVGVKPIIYMDETGVMRTKDKGRGRVATLNKLLDYVIELEDHIKDYPVIVTHCDCIELAEQLAAMLKKQFGDDLNISFDVVNPTAGSHCGPNAMGVTFHAKHR